MRHRACLVAGLLAFLAMLVFPAALVLAAAGTVYSCTMNRCYAHPVTGVIEDSGGEASYATGQGMAEGAIYNAGIMEVTEDGAYYLTFRIGLVDYTSNHSFSVQNVGDTGWSAVAPTVTANGSDGNGTTSDLRILVPSENCVVRCSMYVTPMGRDVIFYFYPGNYTEGNSTGMTAAMVTESTGNAAQAGADGIAQTDGGGSVQANAGDAVQEDGNGAAQTGGSTAADTGGIGTAQTDGSQAAQANSGEGTGETVPAAGSQMASSIEEAAAPAADNDSDQALNSAQGLSLSTAADAKANTEGGGEGNGAKAGISIVDLIAAITVSMTVSGLILMAAAAAIVCHFRKNWRRWGGYEDEEYEDEDD